jgi:enoyl-CoA hydratase
VMVLTGAGGRAFCAGADLKAIDTLDADAPGGPMGFTRLASPKPTIAAISGHCVAGGLELALWCDLRVATPASTFGCVERRWGVPLIDGGTQRLPRVVGMGRALDLILTGRTIGADEALAMGLLTRVAEDALDAALALAEEIAAFPQDTVRSDRQAAIEGFGLPLQDGLALEARLGRERLRTAHDGATRFSERAR